MEPLANLLRRSPQLAMASNRTASGRMCGAPLQARVTNQAIDEAGRVLTFALGARQAGRRLCVGSGGSSGAVVALLRAAAQANEGLIGRGSMQLT